jgi:DNA-binding MarR family transcriptional regulator
METILPEIGETAHSLRKAFTRRAAALGVTGAQWKVLFKLSLRPGLRQVELADMLDVEPITLTRILDRLQEAGLIERSPDPADRRAWRIHVTAKAEPLVEKLREIADDLTAEAFTGVNNQDVQTVRRVLAQVRDNVGRSAPIDRASNA